MNYSEELEKIRSRLAEIVTEARKEYSQASLFSEGEEIYLLKCRFDSKDRTRQIIASTGFISNYDSGAW